MRRLAIIGPRWLTVRDEQGKPRLENELDFVRLEIQSALQRNIRVIPVLVERTLMPSRGALPAQLEGLLRRHAIELSDIGWRDDVGRLVMTLRRHNSIDDIVLTRKVPSERDGVAKEEGDRLAQAKTDRLAKEQADRKTTAKLAVASSFINEDLFGGLH